MPTWTKILYIILFCYSLRRVFTSNIPLYALTFFPAIFSLLALWNFKLACLLHSHGLWVWLVSACMGLLQSLVSTKKLGIRADKNLWRIEIPGNVSLLVLTICLFGIECGLYYIAASSHPALKADVFVLISILASGLPAGMVIGRHLNYFYKFLRANHTDLKKS